MRGANDSGEYKSHVKRTLWHEPKNTERINAWLTDKGKWQSGAESMYRQNWLFGVIRLAIRGICLSSRGLHENGNNQ